MSIRKVKKYTGREKRKMRIRKKVLGTAEKPRLTVYRSLKHMYAQLFDDAGGVSLGMVSTKSKSVAEEIKQTKGKVDAAHLIGKEVAKLALSKNITTVTFDRNGYIYHGRVRAVADGAREAGLHF